MYRVGLKRTFIARIQGLTLLAALAAAMTFAARNGSVNASVLSGVELLVIVAVVLGGTRVQGGLGSIVGSLLGVFIIAVLDEGLRSSVAWGDKFLPFEMTYLRYVLLGLLLIVGVKIHADPNAG